MDLRTHYKMILAKGRADTKKYYHEDRRAWTYNSLSSVLIAVISPIVYNGMGLIATPQFGVSILAGLLSGGLFFFVWRIGVFIYHLVYAPVLLYQEKEDEIKKVKQEKEDSINQVIKDKNLELEKYNWDNVELWVVDYSIIGMSGWAFRIINNKDFDFKSVAAEITTIRIGQKITKLSNKHQLGYIDSRNGEIEEEVVISSDNEGIIAGKQKDFVVTSLKQEAMSQTHLFVTYPKDDTELSFPFPPQTRQSPMASSLTSVVAAMSALYSAQTPETVVVIEIKITGEIKTDDEISVLPIKMINVQVHSNGALSFYGDKKNGSEDEREN